MWIALGIAVLVLLIIAGTVIWALSDFCRGINDGY